jgi:hypothetical protein
MEWVVASGCLSNLSPFVHFTCSVFEAELADHIPVIKTSVAGTRLVGRVCVGKLPFHSGDVNAEALLSTGVCTSPPWHGDYIPP